TEVLPNSPAENAGLQEHDIITAVNGDVVDAERTLRDRLFAYEPDDTITLDVLRDGETIQIEVTLGQPELASDLMPFFNFEIPNLRDALQPRVQPNI
ncbi:MAG TPA: PDZ domain-containing protein, partial [Oceanobacillus sp.]|nr:PDZ domain-containing protein [Oceanobacillus sp.]